MSAVRFKRAWRRCRRTDFLVREFRPERRPWPKGVRRLPDGRHVLATPDGPQEIGAGDIVVTDGAGGHRRFLRASDVVAALCGVARAWRTEGKPPR